MLLAEYPVPSCWPCALHQCLKSSLAETAGLGMQASYERLQEQAPPSPGTKQDIWLYVLPAQGRTRQPHSSEASETVPLPTAFRDSPQQHQQQQQRRYDPQRGSSEMHSNSNLDSSGGQSALHRLSMDMGSTYHSPR